MVMDVAGDALPNRRRSIGRQMTSAYAHDRIATALYDVLVDSMAFGPCSVHCPEARDWLRTAMARSLERSTDAALRRLSQELDRAFSGAPDEVRAWLESDTD